MSAEQTRAEQVAEVLAEAERALRKRLDDWLASTSEFYARERMAKDGGESWRSGLVGYLMHGPGALTPLLAAALADALPDPEQAVREALDAAADAVENECSHTSKPCFCGSAHWLRQRAQLDANTQETSA